MEPGRRDSETAPNRARRAAEIDRLMAAVADGDQTSFAALYDKSAAMVHGAALRVLHDPDLAAEVTQEVMVEVWRRATEFDPARGSALAWITTMARRRAIDRVRAVQAQRNRDDRAAARSHETPFDQVAETVTGSAERDRVRDCLRRLTDLQRDAIVRAYYGGRTYREVADEVAASLPTVKSRIRDGLHRLRTCLGVDR